MTPSGEQSSRRCWPWGASLVSAAALLSGCTVGPDFKPPAVPPADAYAATAPAATASTSIPGGAAQSFDLGTGVSARWWTSFGSPALEERVRQALAASPDLAAAQAALRQAREVYRAERGALFPTVGLDFNSIRAKESDILSSPLDNNADLYTLHTAQVNVSYVLDVFGGGRRGIEASRALLDAQRYQTEAAYLTLTSSVVLAAVNEASLAAQIDATQKVIASDTRLLAILRSRQALGDAARIDAIAQETVLAQAVQTLPVLKKQLIQQRDAAAALEGRYAGQASPDVIDLASLTLPVDLPLSLPADLVKHRPDVAAAAANLHAASAQVGVAVAARLPNLTLTGAYGGESNKLGAIFNASNMLYSVAGDIAQPVFEGGALRHRQRAAEAAFDQAKAQYRSAVLAGCQNVADAIGALQTDADGLQSASMLESAARRSLIIARGQERIGAFSTAQVLNAEATYYQAKLVLTQAQAARYSDTVALYQSLGGGWWNRTTATP